METHDFRVARARRFLADTRRRSLVRHSRRELATESAELRQLLGWVLDVVDDYADTDLDPDVSQVTLWGGVYLAAADVSRLCPGCLHRTMNATGTTLAAAQACP
jgi:hypothetical protein